MHTYYGIWIDHSRTAIIKANKIAEVEIHWMKSEVEPHIHGSADSNEHLTIVNQQQHEERRHNQMKAFSREIIKQMGDADEIVVFGPGTAKHEFKHELEDHKPLAGKLKGVETTDELSEAELKDYVKSYFHLPLQD